MDYVELQEQATGRKSGPTGAREEGPQGWEVIECWVLLDSRYGQRYQQVAVVTFNLQTSLILTSAFGFYVNRKSEMNVRHEEVRQKYGKKPSSAWILFLFF